MKRLKKLATKCGLPVSIKEPVIEPGWVGKPKGALQILFERGWIDKSRTHLYSSDGRKSSACNDDDVEFSIKKLMLMQSDFMLEIPLLPYHANNLGVILDQSPKCHPEIAGEGIEYAWALSKLNYRKAPINMKRTKSNFRRLVQESTDMRTVLHVSRIRSCSKKAHNYMKLYKAVESLDLKSDPTVNRHSILEDSMKLYAKLRKKSKSHRNVLDLNRGDLDDIEIANPITDANQIDTNEDDKSRLIKLLVKK